MQVMQGLELTKKYYFDCVLPLIQKYFPALAEKHSATLFGWGSEVLGNDDEYSKFYEWGPRPKILLTDDDHHKYAKQLLAIFTKE